MSLSLGIQLMTMKKTATSYNLYIFLYSTIFMIVTSENGSDLLEMIKLWKTEITRELKDTEVQEESISKLIEEEKLSAIVYETSSYDMLAKVVSDICETFELSECSKEKIDSVVQSCEDLDTVIINQKRMRSEYGDCVMNFVNTLKELRVSIKSAIHQLDSISDLVTKSELDNQIGVVVKELTEDVMRNSKLNLKAIKEMYGDIEDLTVMCFKKHPYQIPDIDTVKKYKNFHVCAINELRQFPGNSEYLPDFDVLIPYLNEDGEDLPAFDVLLLPSHFRRKKG